MGYLQRIIVELRSNLRRRMFNLRRNIFTHVQNNLSLLRGVVVVEGDGLGCVYILGHPKTSSGDFEPTHPHIHTLSN